MESLDIRITSMYPPGKEGGIRAYASATIGGCLAIRGIKNQGCGGRKGWPARFDAQPEDRGRL